MLRTFFAITIGPQAERRFEQLAPMASATPVGKYRDGGLIVRARPTRGSR